MVYWTTCTWPFFFKEENDIYIYITGYIQSGVRAAKEENDMYMYITGYIQSGVRAAKEENDMYMYITS